MHPPLPLTRELLMIGGGHTHALVLRLWGLNPLPGVRLTVINPDATAPYSGMLPGFVAGHYSRDELDIDLVRLARFAGARLIRGRAVKLQAKARAVTLEDGRLIPYDIAAIDIGITSEMPKLTGFEQFAIPAKPLGRFASEWSQFRDRCRAGAAKPRAAIIGGGVAGVELAMAMAHSLREVSSSEPQITLVEREHILPGMAPSRLKFFRDRLNDCQVTVRENAHISTLQRDTILIENGDEVSAEFIVGAADALAQSWLEDSGLTMEGGFVAVDETLRSLNTPSVFAVGDCAHLSHAPRPKAGVFAVREAPVLYANLRASLTGGKMRAFHPQSDYLKLISLGKKSALADKWGMMFRGPAVWRLKDKIDRDFMDQFTDLKPMAMPSLPKTVADGVADIVNAGPLCGGCGAKIASPTLEITLNALPKNLRDDVLRGPGDDAAILTGPKGTYQVISTDHLRAFSHDPSLVARIAAVHAMGDIWSMGAGVQSALASITLPPLSPHMQEIWMHDIMSAVSKVFAAENATIIGGHSASGAELSIGFTVTGLRDSQPIAKSCARPGDQLILTKALGTGVILAAEMAMQARGTWVMDAYDAMLMPQGDVARLLACANAMTDVSGFGLAGHLLEIARASDVGFTLTLVDIPVLAGAVELANEGVRSSLWSDNRKLAGDMALPETSTTDLLFDPQTAGGLLAAVPEKKAAAVLKAIQKLGFPARIIGQCVDAKEGYCVV